MRPATTSGSRSGDAVAELRRAATTLNLGVTPPQGAILAHPARVQIVYANRRFGKSTLGMQRVIARCRRRNPLGLYWWVAPTYKQCRTPFLTLRRTFQGAGLLTDVSKTELRLELATGWRIEFRSAEIAANLRGEGPDEVVVDEMDQIPDEDFEECLWPALADKQSPLLAIGTPKKGRRGWAYSRYRRGLDGTDPDFKGWQFNAYDAVFVPRAELELARRTLSKRAFEQEFMAALLDGAGVVFEDARRRRRLAPARGEPVGIGVDWAKKVDWTWFVAIGATSGAVVKVQRLPQRMTYPAQVLALADFVAEFVDRGYYVVHDQTGVGEAVGDLLFKQLDDRNGRPFREDTCEGLTFTATTKRELVEETIVDLEAGRYGFVAGADGDPTYEALLKEHEEYTITVTKTGRIEYGAPDGLHDDAVTAAMLANRARRKLSREALDFEPRLSFA